MSVATEIMIQEVTGTQKRSITLRGRSMPETSDDMPIIGGTQARGKVVYPPGNSQADIALSAATWMPSTFGGNWSDNFMFDERNSPTLFGFSGIGNLNNTPRNVRDPLSAASPATGFGGRATTAYQVVQAFQTLCRGLQTLQFTWGPLSYYGILRRFEPRPRSLEYWAWSAEFEWTSDTIVPPKPKVKPRVEAGGLLAFLKRLMAIVAAVFAAVGLPARIYQGLIKGPFDALALAVEEMLNKLTSTITGALSPLNLLDDLRAGLIRIQSAALDLVRALNSILAKFKEPLDPRAAAEADLAILKLSREAERMAAAAAEREAELAVLQTPDLLASLFLTAGQDLRGIATQYYGNPSDWVRILTYNGFTSSNLPDGTLVLVPAKQ